MKHVLRNAGFEINLNHIHTEYFIHHYLLRLGDSYRLARALIVLAILVLGSLTGQVEATVTPNTTSNSRQCVGFNYFHETWTDPFLGSPKFTKTEDQTSEDFERMKLLGATAIRIHGANNDIVKQAVELAKDKKHKLHVWLSYRPNMRDFDIAQNKEGNEHPAHPNVLPDRYFTDSNKKELTEDGLEIVKKFREEFVRQFSVFLDETACLLGPGDVLIVANELAIDLGYEFDNTLVATERALLEHLFTMAQTKLGPDIELTFASMPQEFSEKLSPNDWDTLYEAGMDFVSLNCYWSSQNLREALFKLQKESNSPAMAVTEFGSTAHMNAFQFDGDGSKVASRKAQEYYSGKQEQCRGVDSQLKQIEGLPLRGLFVFAWDEPYDNVFGIVQTNATPLGYGSNKNDDDWTQGCDFDMTDYLPVGKDACAVLAQRWSNERTLCVKLLKPPAEMDLTKVELCHQSSNRKICTTLKCTLKTRQNDYEHGVCRWYMKSGEKEATFWLLDDPMTCSLILNWKNNEQTQINLTPVTESSSVIDLIRWRKNYDDNDHIITISFEKEHLTKGMLDCVFCIDTTGSMMDDIEEVKKTSVETIDAMREYCATNNISLQVGLVTYQDHSDAEQFAGKPEAQWLRAWPMSSAPEVIVSNIRAITINTASAGGDVAEDFYAAAMCAMDARGDWQDKPVAMGWRSGAAKIFIPMADAPPHDPDFEGRTMSVVVNRAEELDPVHVYPIVIQGPVESWLLGTQKAMTNLAERTGGQVTHVSKAEELPPALVKTVKLAVRRHRHEVWRKEHPPYALYIMALVIGLVVIFAFVGVFIAQFRKQPEQAMRRC